jgi:hypothetical protein
MPFETDSTGGPFVLGATRGETMHGRISCCALLPTERLIGGRHGIRDWVERARGRDTIAWHCFRGA